MHTLYDLNPRHEQAIDIFPKNKIKQQEQMIMAKLFLQLLMCSAVEAVAIDVTFANKVFIYFGLLFHPNIKRKLKLHKFTTSHSFF